MKTKAIKLMGIVMAVSLLFAGCGANQGTAHRSPKTYTMKEALEGKGTSIWYKVRRFSDDPIGKDTSIKVVYVFEDNKVCWYCPTNPRMDLGDVAKLDDSEIVEKVRSASEFSSMQPEPFILTVDTDSTGNNTAAESVAFYDSDGSFSDMTFSGTCGLIQIYDKQYAGYSRDEDVKFITRVDNETFTFDTPTTDGIFVDISENEAKELLK